MSRRIVILFFVLACAVSMAQPGENTRRKFNEVQQTILDSNWNRLPVGPLVARVAKQLVGTPYVGGVLEGPGGEHCTVDMLRLDCVTLFEISLNMARITLSNKRTVEDLIDAVTFTRYRDGTISDYTSRLHYTADWIENNIKKGVVTDITPTLGGVPFPLSVGFMSANPKYYPAFTDHPEYIPVMAKIEQRVNASSRTIVPKGRIAEIEDKLQDGDIIAIATSKKGLDYAHTGLIVRDGKRARFLHASSVKEQVVLDEPIAEVISRLDTYLGITVVRPLPVK